MPGTPHQDVQAARIRSLETALEDERKRAEFYRQKWHHATGQPLEESEGGIWSTPGKGFFSIPENCPPMPDYPPGKAPLGRDLPPLVRVVESDGREHLARYTGQDTGGIPLYDDEPML